MSVRCPEGHESESTDYCDVCGAPIAGSAPDPGASPATAGIGPTAAIPTAPAALRPCPNCGFEAAPDALFCEECGYDFTTGALPPPPAPLQPPNPLDLGGPVSRAPSTDPDAVSQPVPAAAVPPPPPAAVTGWVAEVWVDPDWYATQDSQDPCPSAGMPVVVALTQHSLLVGRRSVSRNITPQIDAGTDSGVSRRHVQLTTDGTRWWVEDLQSSNGTYVGAAGAPLPTAPVPQGQRVEFMPGDRIYLGAWTRLVIRQSLPGETP